MSPRLLTPADAAAVIAKRLDDSWAERVCAEVLGEPESPVVCPLRPGVNGTADIERLSHQAWTAWRMAWREIDFAAGLTGERGITCERREITVAGVCAVQPHRLTVATLADGIEAVRRLSGGSISPSTDFGQARAVAAKCLDAGIALTPSVLKAVHRLPDPDFDVAIGVVGWLRRHSDLGQWTTRQLPPPEMDTKWWPKHVGLLSKITGRDLAWETRPRLSVVHVTYVDPDYLASGRRRHDAWTTGDQHDLPYRPRTVLVVENRDCRLWFPEMPETVVVEGEGKAAAALLDGIDWVVDAERLVYWGDIDADGFAILNHLRGMLRERGADVESLLMDEAARRRYAHLGVSRDRAGQPLQPSGLRLGALDRDEANCYTNIATRGPAEFRRIEQERIPLQDAAAELEGLLRRDR